MNRPPAVAGRFYEGAPAALRAQVREFIFPAQKKEAIGIIAPHAGFIYSGAVAGAVYSNILLPDTIVLIGPNHTGLGAPVSIMCAGGWDTPLGRVELDEELARSILARSPHIQEDTLAHLHEHSLEVQLPFIQFLKEKFKIVPIQMMDTRLATCLEVGKALGEAIAECGMWNAECKMKDKSESRDLESKSEIRNVLIVASSDMSHYETAAAAKEKDFKAIKQILNLDPEGLHRTVRSEGITMCGFAPAVAMLAAAKILGASRAELIRYSNSGEISGDFEPVVGYAGIVVE